MEDVRIIAKGRITDLSKGFSLGGVPFSVYVRSKENTMLSDTLLDCRLIGDREKGGAFPVPIGDWTPAMIAYISPNAIDLQKYEVYWGASEQPNKIV